jgi:hypothetical protein
MELGMSEDLLMDGMCVAQVLVKASPERIVECYGAPVLLFRNPAAHVTEKPSNVKVYAAKPTVSEWCVAEPTATVAMAGMDKAIEAAAASSDEQFEAMMKSLMDKRNDYLEPMFLQAAAALRGEVPQVNRTRETPVTNAGMLSALLRVPAIALWGSDEWPGLGGGCLFNSRGEIEQAYSMFSLEEIALCREARKKFPDPSYEDNLPSFNDSGRREQSYSFTPGKGVALVHEDVLRALDNLLLGVEAAQPIDVLDYYDDPAEWAYDYEEVWCAV